MTKPDHARAAAAPVGTRASDYAMSKYYLPPAPPPDAAVDEAADPDHGEAPSIWQAAAEPVTTPPGSAPATPNVPITAGPSLSSRRRSTSPVLVVALVLALLAGVLGGGYWMLNRGDDAPVAEPAGHSVAASARPTTSAKSAATANAAKTTNTKKTASVGVLFTPSNRRWTVRMPHRPQTRKQSVGHGSFHGTQLVVFDPHSGAGLVWLRVNSTIPVGRQDAGLQGGIAAFLGSTRATVTSSRVTTYQGHYARSITAKMPSGARYTVLTAIFQPTHVLFMAAPTGPAFTTMRNSFHWRG